MVIEHGHSYEDASKGLSVLLHFCVRKAFELRQARDSRRFRVLQQKGSGLKHFVVSHSFIVLVRFARAQGQVDTRFE
jgi:hypothetical protein